MSSYSNNPYGTERVKQSLGHFVFGKSAAALIGIALLLLVVRALSVKDYAIYIALLAIMEIAQLASNLGLFTAAYRYVPELRLKNQGTALQYLLLRLSGLRLLTLGVVVVFFTIFSLPLAKLLNLHGYETVFSFYGFIILAEGFARYLDILFDSLLLQKYSQLATLLRSGLRLLGLSVLMLINQSVTLMAWVEVELVASVTGALCSATLLLNYSAKLKKTSPGNIEAKDSLRKSLLFTGSNYLAQLIGLIYGPETTKLLLIKFGDALQIGAFGFAASISAMLQRYLPIFLLLGLVRPLFVTAHETQNSHSRLNSLMNVVLKLNFFVLFPMIAFMLASSNELTNILSGGKFPYSGDFLFIFMVLLVFQTLHMVLGLVTLAIKDGVSGLHGTILGLLGLVSGIVFLPLFGAYSLCAGIVLSEIMWCCYVMFSLTKKGIPMQIDWLGIGKIFTFSFISWLAAKLIQYVFTMPTPTLIIVDMIMVGFIYLFLTFLVKPFTYDERALINKILPKPVFIW